MNYARRGRHDPEVVKGFLAPLQELIALPVPCELALCVDSQRHTAVESVNLNRVIDDQVAGHLRVHLESRCRIARHPDDRRPHGGQVDEGRDTGEILQNDPARGERDLRFLGLRCVVLRQCLNVAVGHDPAVVAPQNRFEQNLDGIRKTVYIAHGSKRIETINGTASESGVEACSGLEGIVS